VTEAAGPVTGPKTGTGYLALCCAVLLWGANAVAARAVHDAVPLPALAFLRWSLTVAVLLPIAWPRLRREWPLIRQVPGLMVWLGLFGIALFSLGLFGAAYLSSATTASLINAIVPFAIILLSPAFGAARPTPRQLLGLAIGLPGVFIIACRGDVAGFFGQGFDLGMVIGVGAAGVWACYTLLLRRVPSGISQISVLTLSGLAGAVLLAPVYIASGLAGGVWLIGVPDWQPYAVAILFIALGPTLLGTLCWNIGVRAIGPARAGIALYAIPAVAVIMAAALLGERLAMYHAVGIALIALGIVATLERRAG